MKKEIFLTTIATITVLAVTPVSAQVSIDRGQQPRSEMQVSIDDTNDALRSVESARIARIKRSEERRIRDIDSRTERDAETQKLNQRLAAENNRLNQRINNNTNGLSTSDSIARSLYDIQLANQ